MPFKNIIVIQDEEMVTKDVRRKKTKQTWQLNITCNAGVGPGLGETCSKDLTGALGDQE